MTIKDVGPCQTEQIALPMSIFKAQPAHISPSQVLLIAATDKCACWLLNNATVHKASSVCCSSVNWEATSSAAAVAASLLASAA